MQEMTYVANRPVRVRGERREPGSLVPEAATWPNKRAYISRGKIAAVPRESVDQDALAEAEAAWNEALEAKAAAEAPETSGEEEEGVEAAAQAEAPSEPEEPSGDRAYEDLTADEVKDLVESGELDPDEAMESELNREDGGRKGVLKFLESLDEG